MKSFLMLLFLFGMASISQAPLLPTDCRLPAFNESLGTCAVSHLDIPFVIDKERNLRVGMRVGNRKFVPAIFDTGASYVEADDSPDATERQGATVITTETDNGEILEAENTEIICVALDPQKSLCMSAATTFNPKAGDALLGNSFTEQFEHIDIDRQHSRLRLSGRTSDRHLVLVIGNEGYKVFMKEKK